MLSNCLTPYMLNLYRQGQVYVYHKISTLLLFVVPLNKAHFQELSILNRLVSAYLDLAEIKALRGEKMQMRDWLVEIDDLLTITRSDVLNSAGTVSKIEAQAKAEAEYEKYKQKSIDELTAVERDCLLSLKQNQKQIEKKTTT